MIFEPAVGQYLLLLAGNIGEFYTCLFISVNVLRHSLCQPFVSPPLEAVTNRNILQNLIYVALDSCFNYVKIQYTYF